MQASGAISTHCPSLLAAARQWQKAAIEAGYGLADFALGWISTGQFAALVRPLLRSLLLAELGSALKEMCLREVGEWKEGPLG